MATNKKQSRGKPSMASGRPRSYSDLYKNDTAIPAVIKTASSVEQRPAAQTTVNWQTEYAHVLGDLRMLLIVSGLLFAAIVVVGFVL